MPTLRAIAVLAALALPAGTMAQQSRPQTVFSPAQNGSLVIRVAVVLPDYSVKPLPLIALIARRNDRADSVAGRTDLDGRISMTLPVGAYTIRAHTPLPIAGRSYSWAVPVVIRASMTETIQLTNANASIDSMVIAAAPAQQVAPTKPMAEAPSERAVATVPASRPSAPVGEAAASSPPLSVGANHVNAVRSNTSGFFLGLSLNGSAIRFDDASNSIESGGGLSAQVGWGFTRNFALLFDVSGAAIRSDGGDYGLGHVELSGRWHFASPSRAFVPFLEAGYAARAAVQNDVVYFDDFGNVVQGDFSLLGSGVSFGGGLQYHVTPTMALGGSIKWTAGKFSTVKVDNVSVNGFDISATTARVNLGFTWYPVQQRVR